MCISRYDDLRQRFRQEAYFFITPYAAKRAGKMPGRSPVTQKKQGYRPLGGVPA